MSFRSYVFKSASNVLFLKRWPDYGRIRQQQKPRDKSTLQAFSKFNSDPSMFSMAVVRKNWETIPMLLITGVGILLEVVFIIRNVVTRDDVHFWPRSKRMPFEGFEYIEKGDKPPVHKLYVRNQKYEWADGLCDAMAALREPTEEEKVAIEAERKKKKKK